MGWANCGTDSKGRRIGYAFPATCDHPGCKKRIDRGVSYACGGMHGSSDGCEGYFCGDHLRHRFDPGDERGKQFCFACAADLDEQRAEDFECALLSIVAGADPIATATDQLARWGELANRPDADTSSPSNVGHGRPSDSAPEQSTPKEHDHG